MFNDTGKQVVYSANIGDRKQQMQVTKLAYQVRPFDQTIICTEDSATNCVITLPSLKDADGRQYVFAGAGRAGDIVLTAKSGELIAGNATLTIGGSGCTILEATPLGWVVIGNYTAGVIEPTSIADAIQLTEADENKVLVVNASGLLEGYFPSAGKVGIMTDAGFVEITPVADVTDFTVAVGDLISVKNGIITKLEHSGG